MFDSTEHITASIELSARLAEVPTAQEAVLGYLLDAGGEPLTEAEVRTALHLPKTTAHMALSLLVRQELVNEERIGRTGRFSVDTSDPLVRLLKTARAVRRVQAVIAAVRDRLDLVVLFGSASRGEDRRSSDVDILVVTGAPDAVQAELAQHQWLQPMVMSPEKHMMLVAEDGTIARETARGITIWERT